MSTTPQDAVAAGPAAEDAAGPRQVTLEEADSQLTVKTQDDVAKLREFMDPAWNAVNDFLMKSEEERQQVVDVNGSVFITLGNLFESKDFASIYGSGAQMETETMVLSTGLLPYNVQTREMVTRQVADLWIALFMTRCGSMFEKIVIEVRDPALTQDVPHVAVHLVTTTCMRLVPPSVVSPDEAADTAASNENPTE